MEKLYYSIPEVAEILGLSRISIYKKVKNGQIKAQKAGRNFIIEKSELENILGLTLSEEQKKVIENGVRRTVKEYGETLKKLGSE